MEKTWQHKNTKTQKNNANEFWHNEFFNLQWAQLKVLQFYYFYMACNEFIHNKFLHLHGLTYFKTSDYLLPYFSLKLIYADSKTNKKLAKLDIILGIKILFN